MDHTGDDRTVSVLFGNTWQDVNASVYAAVSAIVSSVVNGVDPSLAPRVRKAMLTAYMIQSRQTMRGRLSLIQKKRVNSAPF